MSYRKIYVKRRAGKRVSEQGRAIKLSFITIGWWFKNGIENF
jgi:hypothetical protein